MPFSIPLSLSPFFTYCTHHTLNAGQHPTLTFPLFYCTLLPLHGGPSKKGGTWSSIGAWATKKGERGQAPPSPIQHTASNLFRTPVSIPVSRSPFLQPTSFHRCHAASHTHVPPVLPAHIPLSMPCNMTLHFPPFLLHISASRRRSASRS